jgi:ATP-dependent DNA helicase Q1
MPTGGGKSLCFQLPALLDSGTTLVVSPLISLMEDQLWMLKRLEIKAESINSSSTKEHVKYIHDQMIDPKSDLKLLYVTPERLAKSKMFMNKLQKMYEMGQLARLVIDEVHCCSTYGHDFRPDYKFLGTLKRLFPDLCILGLTATATQDVIEDIKKMLCLKKCVLFKAGFNRPNIFYDVKQKPSSLKDFIDDVTNVIRTQFNQQSGIIYCFTQRESEEIANELKARGLRASAYHAQIEATKRSKIHENWMIGKCELIVATIAFGMGIDKTDCRFVIHHSLSKSLENFYQESGRAGRDGERATSILYFRFADVFRQSSMVFHEVLGLKNLYSMVNYCIDNNICKRRLIADHFNDTFWDKNAKCLGMCCVCSKTESNGQKEEEEKEEERNWIVEVNFIIETLDKHSDKSKEKRITANKLAEIVYTDWTRIHKQNEKKGTKNNHKLTCQQIERLILVMLFRKYLKEDFHFTPYNTICYIIKGKILI